MYLDLFSCTLQNLIYFQTVYRLLCQYLHPCVLCVCLCFHVCMFLYLYIYTFERERDTINSSA